MNQIGKRKKHTINGNALRTWGLLFLLAGVLGRGLIQNHILGVGSLTTQQLLEVMGSSRQAMTMATASLVLQALETCAVPLYALMLVEGVQNTSGFPAYFKRIFVLALLCELLLVAAACITINVLVMRKYDKDGYLRDPAPKK